MSHRALLALVLLSGAASLPAQDLDLRVAPPRDSVIQHARELVGSGNFAQARRVLDSVLAANVPEGAIYAEALYWRGALAETAADAERDYRRLLIESPFSARAEDALLGLAQLQHARGDRRGASEHLHRYLLTYPNSESRPARPKVALWLVRLLFEQHEATRGCEALRMEREATADEGLEFRNQVEFYASRCDHVDVAAGGTGALPQGSARTDTAKPAAAAAAPPPPRRPADARTPPPSPRQPETPAAKPFFSVQVAAYDSPEAAQRMADGLVARGLEARVDGTKRPFRVRIGKFATRAEAVKLAQTLKSQGQNGFVTQATP